MSLFTTSANGLDPTITQFRWWWPPHTAVATTHRVPHDQLCRMPPLDEVAIGPLPPRRLRRTHYRAPLSSSRPSLLHCESRRYARNAQRLSTRTLTTCSPLRTAGAVTHTSRTCSARAPSRPLAHQSTARLQRQIAYRSLCASRCTVPPHALGMYPQTSRSENAPSSARSEVRADTGAASEAPAAVRFASKSENLNLVSNQLLMR